MKELATHADREPVGLESARTAVQTTICMLFLEVPGRTEARLMRDAVALVQGGFNVTIVDVENDRTRPQEEDIEGVHFYHLFSSAWYTPTRFKLWFPVKLAFILARSAISLARLPADIYHVHVEKAFLAAYFAARWRRKPLLFDSPDLPLSDPHLMNSRVLKGLAGYALKSMVPHCVRIITASPFYAQEIRKTYPHPEVSVILNVPPYQEVEKSDRLRQQLGLAAHVRIALYQGNIQPDRELERLVYAARHLEPDIVIVMMGRGLRGVPEQLQELIAREGVADRVKIIPAVPYAELLDWTTSADIGLTLFSPEYSTSIRYTLPNKLFEYLMAGLPVLSMKLEAIAEVLQSYDVGHVIQSLEPSEIAAGINSMLAEPELLERMKQNALAIAREKFNWEKERLHLLRIYHEVLS